MSAPRHTFVPPPPPPGAALRGSLRAGAAAGAALGLLEVALAWGLGTRAAGRDLLGWALGGGLVLLVDLLLGGAGGALAGGIVAAHMRFFGSPWARLRRWWTEPDAAARAERAALALAGVAVTIGGLVAAGWALQRVPQWVHSDTFRPLAALASFIVLTGAGLAAAPVVAWPLAWLLRRGGRPAQVAVLGLVGAAVCGLAVALLARLGGATLAALPWGWPLRGLVWLGVWAGVLRCWPTPPRSAPAAQLGAVVLGIWTLFLVLLLGSFPAGRSLAQRETLLAARGLDLLRWAADVDRDGVASILGGGDCAPLDARIHPGAIDHPGNGLDEDCWGGDAARAHSLGGLPVGHRPPAGTPVARNLLLISIDALRADHVGAYGYPRPVTPNIDALAAQGQRFERFYSPSPATRWALPMLQLSRWPSEIAWDKRTFPHLVKPPETTLAELLRAGGLATGTVWIFRSNFGLRQGFERWNSGPSRGDARAPEVSDEGIRLLQSFGSERFYLWLHYYDTHAPYRGHDRPDLPRFATRPVDRYDESLALVDHEVGRVLAALEAAGRAADTLVVLTADHGEEFGDHGGTAHFGKLYQELIHIPLILRGPGLGAGLRGMGASLVDLAPTILDLLQVSAARPQPWAGRSLAAYLWGVEPERARPVFASLAFFPTDGARARAVVRADRKLIHDPTTGLIELYDLARDPHERRDLARGRAAEVDELMGILLPWMAAHSPEGRAANGEGS